MKTKKKHLIQIRNHLFSFMFLFASIPLISQHMVLSPDGKTIAFAYKDEDDKHNMIVADLTNQEATIVNQYEELEHKVSSLHYSPSGSYIYFTQEVGSLWRYDLGSEEIEELENGFPNSESTLSQYKDGNLYLTIRGESTVKEILNTDASEVEDISVETSVSLSPLPSEVGQSSGGMNVPSVYINIDKENSHARILDHTYELTDHLGNVREIVGDRRDNTEASIESIGDYYAYGMNMPGLGYSALGHRYGFNGMEKDNELSGVGNSYDFGARQYDSRLGRWLSRDPMEGMFPSMSGYNFVLNNPLRYIDPDGRIPIETVWDIAALAFDATWYGVTGDPAAGAAIAADVTAILTPYAPSPGPIMTIVGRTAAEEIVDIPVKVAPKAVSRTAATHTVENAVNATATTSVKFIDDVPVTNVGSNVMRPSIPSVTDDIVGPPVPGSREEALALKNRPNKTETKTVTENYQPIRNINWDNIHPYDPAQIHHGARYIAQENAKHPNTIYIVAHGTEGGIKVNQRAVNAQQYAKIFKRNNPDWKGKKITLLSCGCGANPDGFAQQFANEMGTKVSAPNVNVKVTTWKNKTGEKQFGLSFERDLEGRRGRMVDFEPQKKQ